MNKLEIYCFEKTENCKERLQQVESKLLLISELYKKRISDEKNMMENMQKLLGKYELNCPKDLNQIPLVIESIVEVFHKNIDYIKMENIDQDRINQEKIKQILDEIDQEKTAFSQEKNLLLNQVFFQNYFRKNKKPESSVGE